MFDKVKAVKWMLISVLLIIVAIIPGELFQGYLDQYNDFYETSFYLPDNISANEMLRDLSDTANKYNIHIFKIYESEKKTYAASLEIYADEEMVNILAEDYGISQGEFKSLFSGKTDIRMYKFSDISEELLKQDAQYYLYGDSENMVLFKEVLVDTYAGSFPQDDGYNDLESYKSMLLVMWIFVIVLVVLLTIYDTMSQKREVFVRLTMGERIGFMYWKNVIWDTGYMLVLYGVLRMIVRNLEGKLIFDFYSNLMFGLMVLVNGIIFLGIIKVDYKSAMAYNTGENGVLKYNYFLCGICMLLLVTGIGSCVELICTSYRYSKQETYFSEHKEYNWYQSVVIEDEQEQNLQIYLNDFMKKNADSVFYLCQGGEVEENVGNYFYEASRGTKEYLQSKIPELKKELNCGTYILAYENSKISDAELKYIVDWSEAEDYQIIYYSDSIDIVYRVFDEEPITEIVNNPVILFHNNDGIKVEDDGCTYEISLCMMDTLSARWKEFADEYNISYVETNAWDYYCYRWESLSRTLLINAVIIIIMFIMQILVSCVIIKLEFKVNAKELALKKIHGYHIFQRFGKIYGMIGAIGVFGLITVFFIKLVKMEINPWYIILLLLIIVCMEYIYITWQIVLYEKKNLQIIFKGGNI